MFIVRKYSTETTNLHIYTCSILIKSISPINVLLNSHLQFYDSEGIDISLQRIFAWVNKDQIDMTKDISTILEEFNKYADRRTDLLYDVAVLLR